MPFEIARVRQRIRLGFRNSFMSFWLLACLVWTTSWLLIAASLPDGIGMTPSHVTAVGAATGLMPLVILRCGHAFLWAAHRLEPFISASIGSLKPAARSDDGVVRSRFDETADAEQIGSSRYPGTSPLSLDRDPIARRGRRAAL
jgi:hypothetical protein